jgi:hypothetical protein
LITIATSLSVVPLSMDELARLSGTTPKEELQMALLLSAMT